MIRVASQITVVGSVNIDLFFEVAQLPSPGQTVLASAARSEPGGKGGNQAVAAARAGAHVQLIAATGTDANGIALRKHLRDNNVGIDAMVTLPLPSGAAAIMVGADPKGSAENMIVVAPGANAHLTMDSVGARRLAQDCDVLLLQLEIPLPTALAAARQAKAAGAVVMLNASPAGTDSLSELAAVADVVIVNETEANQWHWPVPHLVITRGAAGVTYRGTDEETHIAAPAVEAVDTTGAGDVFAGVLAAGWTTDPQHALRRAVTAAALATLVPGAGNCAPPDEVIEDALAGPN